MYLWTVLLVFAFLLPSCTTITIVVTPTPEPSPTATFTPTPTATLLFTATPTSTATVPATSTLPPTATFPPGSCLDLAERFQYNSPEFNKCTLYPDGTFSRPFEVTSIDGRIFTSPKGFKPFYTKSTDVFCDSDFSLKVSCSFNVAFYKGRIGYQRNVYLEKDTNYFIKLVWLGYLHDRDYEYNSSTSGIGAKVGSSQELVSPMEMERTGKWLVGGGEHVWAIRPTQNGIYNLSVYFIFDYGIFDEGSKINLTRIDVLRVSSTHHLDNKYIFVSP